MRKVLLLATLIATSGNSVLAVPYLDGNSPQAETKQSSGWHLPRLWGKKDVAPDPQFTYRPPAAAPPSTTQRITSALVDNRAVAGMRGWMGSANDASGPQEQANPLSLSHPTGPPTPSLMVSMAQIQEKQGDSDGARKLYLKALAANPKNVKTLRELGHFEDRQNHLADAERYYAEAANIDPQNAAVLNDLALCLARQNKLEQSAQLLDQAIALAPSKALFRNNMATVLMEMGQQHQAMGHLMAVHSPAASYFNMGHLLEKGGQLEAAAAHYAEAQRLDPNLQAAGAALARVAPQSPSQVPQTAMAPTAPSASSFSPQQQQAWQHSLQQQQHTPQQQAWPSESLPATIAKPASVEPDFGPRLLPPVD